MNQPSGPVVSQPTDALSVGLSPAAFAQLSGFITRELGIKMPPDKLPMLQARLQRRVHQLGLTSLDEYLDCLFDAERGEQELVEFVNLVTTNKTDFFREPRHFQFLTETALPSLPGAVTPGSRLDLWCAGCSTGEEVYTLGMVVHEWQRGHPGSDFAILGTDISTRVLALARAGIYREAQVAPVPAALRHRYFLRGRSDAELLRVVPELRGHMRFGRLNFMSEEYGLRAQFDVVFFRNVLIYFERATQEAILQRICRHLRRGGYLFVSHSESLVGFDLPLTNLGGSVFRRRP